MDFVKLEKGKVIDAQPGFVDSWNRMVDCWNNLTGVGKASVEWPIDNVPTIKVESTDESDVGEEDDDVDDIPELVLPAFDPCRPSSFRGRFQIKITSAESQGGSATASFTNRYYDIGGKTYEASDGSVSVSGGEIIALKVTATGSVPIAQIVTYSSLGALQNDQEDRDFYISPLYKIGTDGAVECDMRIGPTFAMGEF